jgi:hypothetical protein
MGERVGGPPSSEAEHFWKCGACGGWFDMRESWRVARPSGAVADLSLLLFVRTELSRAISCRVMLEIQL